MLIMFSSWSQGDTSPKMIYRTKPTYRRFTGLTTVFIDQRPTITGSLPTAYFSISLWRAIKTLALLLHSSCANFAVDAQAKQEWYANLAGVWGIPALLKNPAIKKETADRPGESLSAAERLQALYSAQQTGPRNWRHGFQAATEKLNYFISV